MTTRFTLSNPILQVALDFIEKDDALRVAELAVRGGVDWIEAGTPLIKSVGISIVKTLKNKYPDKLIVADMKTMDTGSLEVELAVKNGADVVSVLGVADDKTISDAVKTAHAYNAILMVDLINCKDITQRAREVEHLGADIILVHAGIDQQAKGISPFEDLKKIHAIVKTPLAIAGGLNEKTVSDAIKMGAKVIIVGSAITKSEDPYLSTLKIKQAIQQAQK
ncbi:MAG: 3-hexulose-6-phosphate synthase [Candidatus Asgardarchaeia archaeon]